MLMVGDSDFKEGDDQAHDTLALDRSSNRTTDKNGFLHVAISNISKAAVNPYCGKEIPGYVALGLDPEKIYQLFRDPEEMAKAVDTLNGVPLLNRHIPVIPEKLPEDAIVGAIGKDATFADPFLKNSLTVWAAKSIEGINSRKECQLSAGYRYVPVMEPGVYQGQKFDGRMTNLGFNHVSIVVDGRAGPECVVGDTSLVPTDRAGSAVIVGDASLPNLIIMETTHMAKVIPLSRKAAHVKGAVAVALAPKMIAMDAKLDFNKILSGVTAKNYSEKLPGIKDGLVKATTGKLAQDATLDDVNLLLDRLDKEDPSLMDDEMPEPMTGDDDVKAFIESMKDKMSPEEHAKLCELVAKKPVVGDEEETETPGKKLEKTEVTPMTKQAMDAAIAAGVKAVADRLAAVREAERIVRPHIGELTQAMDSADAIYRMALDHAKVDHKAVTETAGLKALVQMIPAPGAQPAVKLAFDAAAADSYAKRFPNAHRLSGKGV